MAEDEEIGLLPRHSGHFLARRTEESMRDKWPERPEGIIEIGQVEHRIPATPD
jgi:hypothetical protein